MDIYQEVKKIINEADGILIGASNGLSIAEGYNLFADDSWFQKNMEHFRNRYGIHCIIQGMAFPYFSQEEKWVYFSRIIKGKCMQNEPSQIMKNMYELVKEKDYFVVTTNGEDHFIPAGFLSKRVFEMEGKLTEMRCSNDCCDEVYSIKETALQIAEAEKKGEGLDKFLPKCPKCGGNMEVNYGESSSFMDKKNWQEKAARYREFVNRFRGKRLVALEFGVGRRNQLIKVPFMQLVSVEPQAKYITFNKGEIHIPQEIQNKSIGVAQDIAVALAETIKAKFFPQKLSRKAG